jgi:hypothetical protein
LALLNRPQVYTDLLLVTAAMDKPTKLPSVDTKDADDHVSEGVISAIYIEPEKEAAARRKFDKFLVPVSLIFIILSALDRNNVGDRVSFPSLL